MLGFGGISYQLLFHLFNDKLLAEDFDGSRAVDGTSYPGDIVAGDRFISNCSGFVGNDNGHLEYEDT